MKLKIDRMNLKLLCLLVFFGIFVTGCTKKATTKNNNYISVSIEPQRFFAEKIVGNKFLVKSVVPAGSNPESFDPAPSEMMILGDSRAYFMIGLFGFEKVWKDNLSQSNPEMLLVDCSSSIRKDKSLMQSAEHTHEGHSHGTVDPHIWNSPKTALLVAQCIFEGVVKMDPVNKNYYEQNFSNLKNEISETDSIVRTILASAQKKTFIIYHPALSYFADEYGLEQLSIEFNGKSPSPSQMTSLIREAKNKGIKTIFIQPEFDKKNAQVLAREIGGRVFEINPLAYEWKDEMIKIAKAIANQ